MSDIQVVSLTPSTACVIGPQELVDWRARHTLKVPGHEWSPGFKRGYWDGTWAPGAKTTKDASEGRHQFLCSRGLVPRIVQDFGQSILFEAAYAQEIEEFCGRIPRRKELRDYQERALRQVLQEGWGRIAFATNAGKGAVIALLAAFAKQRGEPVLILCDEIAVFEALEKELEEWGNLTPALIRAGAKRPPSNGVALAMVPTLARRLADKQDGKVWAAWLRKCRMLLMDEADKADANTWRSIIAAAMNTTWRAGFSGSFSRELYHELRMEELMGPVLERITNKTMVERGVSARPRIEVHAYDGTDKVEELVGRFEDRNAWWSMEPAARRKLIFEHAIVYNQARHAFVAGLIRPHIPTVIVISRVDHGTQLAEHIPGSVFLDGSVSEGGRSEALDSFTNGETQILIVTKILDRGSNRLGSADDLIFGSGEGSPTQVLQRIGRGLRRTNGKEFLRLVDVVDRVVTGDGKMMQSAAGPLHNAAKRRLQVYAQEGFEVTLNL